MNSVSTVSIQQINDLTFYKRSNRWVDSRLVANPAVTPPSRVINFGTDEFKTLASRLAGEGRQGSIALRGDILMVVDGEPVLIKAAPDQP